MTFAVERWLTVIGLGSEQWSGLILDRGCPNSCFFECDSVRLLCLCMKLEPFFSLLTTWFHVFSPVGKKIYIHIHFQLVYGKFRSVIYLLYYIGSMWLIRYKVPYILFHTQWQLCHSKFQNVNSPVGCVSFSSSLFKSLGNLASP